MRSHILLELPKILNLETNLKTPTEDCLMLFNYVNEAPVIDFKREINYKKLYYLSGRSNMKLLPFEFSFLQIR